MPARIARLHWGRLLNTGAHRSAGRLTRHHTEAAIYMQGPDYASVADAAIRSGVNKDAPCIIVSAVNRPEQQIFSTTLRHLDSVATLPVPAVIIIGDVAGAPKDGLVSQFCRQMLENTIAETTVQLSRV